MFIPHSNPWRPLRTSRAFTLLELMVSVALLAVIIVGLLAMFSQVQRAWKSGITQVDVMEGGRATMALIVRDLQEMVALPATNGLDLNFEAAHSSIIPLELDLVDGTTRTNSLHDLTFLKRMEVEWGGVAYRVTNSSWGVGTLFRLAGTLHPNTLTNYYTFPTNIGQLGVYLMNVELGNYPNELTMFNGQSIGAQERYYGHSDFARVADGVVHFTLRAYDNHGALLQKSSLTNQPSGLVDFFCYNEKDGNGAITNQVIPAYIEVELAMVEPAVLERFNARANLDATPNKQTARDYLRKKAGQVHIFRQRVPIRPAATTVGPLLPGS